MAKRGENIRKRKDGRWEARHKIGRKGDGSIQYHSVYGKTYREVKQKLETEIQNHHIPKQSKRGTETFEHLTLNWWEASAAGLKGSTKLKYRYLIEKHILPELGGYALHELSKDILTNYIERKTNLGRLDGTGALSPSYVKTMFYIIKSVLEYGCEHQLPVHISCSDYRFSGMKNKKRPVKYLSLKDLKELEANVCVEMAPVDLGILLSLNTGMRIGEICALKWEDIDLENRIIHVRHTLSRVCEENSLKSRLIRSTPKTESSRRDIPVSLFLYEKLLAVKEDSHSEYVTSEKEDCFLNPRTLEYHLTKKLSDLNLQHVNFHALRHTFASRCIEAGVDPKTLSELLGHSNVSTTLQIYTHISLEQKRMQLEKIYL